MKIDSQTTNANFFQSWFVNGTKTAHFKNTGAYTDPLELNTVGGFNITGGDVTATNLTASGTVSTGSYTVSTLPAVGTGQLIFVTDETGGAIHCFSDGTNWRRLSDRAIVS